MLTDVLLILAGYLVGSIATAVITCRLMGLPDPRTVGSGNPGATNVLREGGRRAAIMTLAGDVLKGLVPVLVATALATGPLVPALVAFATFLGHLYPVFVGFRGGKGVATAFGAMLGLSWPLALAVLATWLVMAFAFRYSSLSALCGAVLAPAYAYALDLSAGELTVVAVMSLLLLWRHRSNFRNLLAGRENKIGAPKSPPGQGEGQALDGAGN